MATASAAGAWQSGAPAEWPHPARASRPPLGNDRPARPPRPSRSAPPEPRRAGDRLRAAEREHADDRFDEAYARSPRRREPTPPRPAAARPGGGRPAEVRGRERLSGPPAARDGKVPGAVAILGVFLLTLAGCAVDSFVGMGLGTTTLVTLAGGISVATLLVRRHDLLTVVVAPPLVFVLVAMVNISLAPSATFNLATMATLLVRGFPTMAAATAVAVVLTLVRLATRR